MNIAKQQKLTGSVADIFHLTIATAWIHGDFYGVLDDAGKSKWAADSARNYCEVVGVDCTDDMIASCRKAWEFGAKYGSHDSLAELDAIKWNPMELIDALQDSGHSKSEAKRIALEVFEQINIENNRQNDPEFREKQGQLFDTSECTFVDARNGEWKEVSQEEFLSA